MNHKVIFLFVFSKEFNSNRTKGRKNAVKQQKKKQATNKQHVHILHVQPSPSNHFKEKCSLDRWCFPCLDFSSNLLFGETKFSTELHITHQQRINRLNIACSQIAAVLWCSTARSPLRTVSASPACPAPGWGSHVINPQCHPSQTVKPPHPHWKMLRRRTPRSCSAPVFHAGLLTCGTEQLSTGGMGHGATGSLAVFSWSEMTKINYPATAVQ